MFILGKISCYIKIKSLIIPWELWCEEHKLGGENLNADSADAELLQVFQPSQPTCQTRGWIYCPQNFSLSGCNVGKKWGLKAYVCSCDLLVNFSHLSHLTSLDSVQISDPPESWDNKAGEKDTVVSIICSSDNKHRWDLLSFFSSSASSLAPCHFPSFPSCSHPISHLHKNHLCSPSIWLYLKLAGSVGNHTL